MDISAGMLNTYVPLQNPSVDSDMLAKLNLRLAAVYQSCAPLLEEHNHRLFCELATAVSILLYRPESHRADPRDKVPTTVKETTPQMTNKLPIMHIKATPNNTYITLSDSKGKVMGWTSAVSGNHHFFL